MEILDKSEIAAAAQADALAKALSEVTPRSEMLEAALDYARRGFRVFPLSPGSKIPFAGTRGLLEATAEPMQIMSWWHEHPEANIGLATGKGLVVLDVDPAHGGGDSLATLLAGEPAWDTPTVITGRGGLHFYFKSDKPFTNSKVGTDLQDLVGLDVRGDGGYVLAPPSRTKAPYEWDKPLNGDFKAWPWPLILESKNITAQPVDDVIPEGQRNSTLVSLAGSMRRRGMTPEEIEVALTAVNERRCNPPLHQSELKSIARSAKDWTPAPSPIFAPDLEAISAVELVESEIPEPTWLVQGLWRSGAIGFISGPPKSFKSFYSLEMAFSIATGSAFLGKFTVPVPQTALYLQRESSRSEFRDRVRRAQDKYGPAPNLYILTNKALFLEDDGDYERLRYMLGRIRPALVFVDSFSFFTRANENNNQEMSLLMQALHLLRDEFGCGFALIHHWTKTPPGNGEFQRTGERLRGGSALYANSEVTIGIRRVSDNINRSHVWYELKDAESPPRQDIQFDEAAGLVKIFEPTPVPIFSEPKNFRSVTQD